MAEYSKEKFYFLQLSKDFFNSYDIKILEAEKNGVEIGWFMLKLMCESTSHNGELRFSPEKPYTNTMLARALATDIKIVNKAMRTLTQLGFIFKNENGTIIIPKVKEMTISRTKGAMLKEEQRTKGGQKGKNCPPYIRYKSIEYRDKILEEENKEINFNKKENKELNDVSLTEILDEIGG